MEKEIHLTFHREAFEAIYFRNNQGSYTKGHGIQIIWRGFLIFLGIALASMLYTYVTNKAGLIMVIAILSTLIVGTYYVISAAKIFKWKQTIYDYLDEVEKVGNARIILTEAALTFLEDEKESVEKWSAFKRLIIENDYALLQSDIDYLFPKQSMSPEEFDYFTRFASERIKQPA